MDTNAKINIDLIKNCKNTYSLVWYLFMDMTRGGGDILNDYSRINTNLNGIYFLMRITVITYMFEGHKHPVQVIYESC